MFFFGLGLWKQFPKKFGKNEKLVLPSTLSWAADDIGRRHSGILRQGVGEPGVSEAPAGGHAGKLQLKATTTFYIVIILLTTVICSRV
jgi:hypothetical protein